jgi:hypothetical protein
MLEFHKQVPRGYFETTYFLAHHGRRIAKWRMLNGNKEQIGDGLSYGEFGPDGKLVSMTGFFELPQPCELFLPDPARHRRHPCTCARRAGPH